MGIEEKRSDPNYSSVLEPNLITLNLVKQIRDKTQHHLQVAEIGIAVGATSLELCRILDGRGTVHLFDFEDVVEEVGELLKSEGFKNFRLYPNSKKLWDSYHWPLLKILHHNKKPVFDYAFLDGSHAALHEAATIGILEHLIRPGGFLDLDDYAWTYANSNWWNPNKPGNEWVQESMTEEQLSTPQVALVVEAMIKTNPLWKMIVENKIFQKAD